MNDSGGPSLEIRMDDESSTGTATPKVYSLRSAVTNLYGCLKPHEF